MYGRYFSGKCDYVGDTRIATVQIWNYLYRSTAAVNLGIRGEEVCCKWIRLRRFIGFGKLKEKSYLRMITRGEFPYVTDEEINYMNIPAVNMAPSPCIQHRYGLSQPLVVSIISF